MAVATREPQYSAHFDEGPVTLGPMASATWRNDAKRLGFVLDRYTFVAKMLEHKARVAEIGCGDGFGSQVVRQHVARLDTYDFDNVWGATVLDITKDPLPKQYYDAVYMLDVLEHIDPEDEPWALTNICVSLTKTGVFIAGCPSLESQTYASPQSKAGHVNCRSGDVLRRAMQRYFDNVFLFGMNDGVIHTGFLPMCHYLFVLCTGPRHGAVKKE